MLNPLKDTYQADDIARDYLHMTLPSYQELFGKETLAAQLARIDEEETAKRLKSYFGYLSCIPLMAWAEMKKQLAAEGMLGLMEEIEMPTVYYLFEMERLGVQANAEVLKEMSELLERRVLALETDIYDLAGEEFNINSPKQLGVILFEKLKLPFAKKTKTGYSTSADILEKLRTEDPIIDKILEYRQVSKLKSTYADGLPVFIDGRSSYPWQILTRRSPQPAVSAVQTRTCRTFRSVWSSANSFVKSLNQSPDSCFWMRIIHRSNCVC